MEKGTKKVILLLTYGILLYWALTNIQLVSSGISNILNVLSPIFIGVFLAFVLNILLNLIENRFLGNLFQNIGWLQKRKRVIAVIFTYIGAIAIIAAIIFFIVPQVFASFQSLINKLPQYMQSLEEDFIDLFSVLGITDIDLNELFGNWEKISHSITEFLRNAAGTIFNITMNITSAVTNFFIGVIFSIYFLLYKDKIGHMGKKLVLTFIPQGVAHKIIYAFKQIYQTFTRFIGGQLTEATILGSMCFIGMILLKLPYAPLISVLVGVTSLIPILGAYIATVPSTFIILMESPVQAIIFVVFIIVIQQIEGNFIYPKVVGSAIGLDGLWVFLAITLGGKIFGILGMVLGVPSMAVIYTLVRNFTNRRYRKKFKKP